MNTQAVNRYLVHLERATEAAARISQYLDDHGEVSPDDIHWGHTGSMDHLASQLEGLVNMIDERDNQ
jgi:hypothetical protein